MDVSSYSLVTVLLSSFYLFLLMFSKKNRILLPSVIHSLTWLLASLCIFLHVNGFLFSNEALESSYDLSSKFIFYIVLSSIVGFTLAHLIPFRQIQTDNSSSIDINLIDKLLVKYKWIPYFTFFIGVMLFAFFVFTLGGFTSFHDYRIHALYVERVGVFSILQRISGHISILASFYLMLLGYKYGKHGINIRQLLLYIFLCSAINISIGGRLWIVLSLLPFLATYSYSRQMNKYNNDCAKSDNRRILLILFTFVSLFSILGMFRSDGDYEGNTFDRFLYFTDGARITNMVLSLYPDDTFNLEYGISEFLSGSVTSPMMKAFTDYISGDIGLSVTVKSALPYLYFDFGFWGGVLMWGVFCFIIEILYFSVSLKKSVVSIICIGILSPFFFNAPIFNVFALAIPSIEWLIIIAFFKNKLLT